MSDKLHISRKELLKEPDKFLTFGERILHYYNEHSATLGWGLAGLALFFVVGMVISSYSERKQFKMETMAFQLQKVIDDGKTADDTRASELNKIFEQIDEGEQKQRARLALADFYYRRGQLDESVKLFEEVTGKSRQGELNHGLAQMGLAHVHDAKKEYKKAIEIFRRLIDSAPRIPAYPVYLDLARCYEEDGDSKDALLVLREAQSKFPNHAGQEKVTAWIKRLERA